MKKLLLFFVLMLSVGVGVFATPPSILIVCRNGWGYVFDKYEDGFWFNDRARATSIDVSRGISIPLVYAAVRPGTNYVNEYELDQLIMFANNADPRFPAREMQIRGTSHKEAFGFQYYNGFKSKMFFIYPQSDRNFNTTSISFIIPADDSGVFVGLTAQELGFAFAVNHTPVTSRNVGEVSRNMAGRFRTPITYKPTYQSN